MALRTSKGSAAFSSSWSEPAPPYITFPKPKFVELFSSLGSSFYRNSGDILTEVADYFPDNAKFISNWIRFGLTGYTIFRSLLNVGSFN